MGEAELAGDGRIKLSDRYALMTPVKAEGEQADAAAATMADAKAPKV